MTSPVVPVRAVLDAWILFSAIVRLLGTEYTQVFRRNAVNLPLLAQA